MRPVIWVVNPWDALPGERGNDRGEQIVRALECRGYSVVWVQTSFAHAEKRQRACAGDHFSISDHISIAAIPACAYTVNFSVGRFLSNAQVALGLLHLAVRLRRPDKILVCGPFMLSEIPAIALKTFCGTKLYWEYRDSLPDIIVQASPRPWRWAAEVLCLPLFTLREIFAAHLDAAVAVNRTYAVAVRRISRFRDMPIGVSYPSPYAGDVLRKRCRVQLRPDTEPLRVVFSGTIGSNYDHATAIAAIKLLHERGTLIELEITGDGPMRSDLQARVRKLGLEHVVRFRGSLPFDQFVDVMCGSDVGLAIYKGYTTVAFPNKFMDYIGAGLVLITSCRGEAKEIVEGMECGTWVPAEKPIALAAALERLALDRQRCARVRSNVARLARRFSVESSMDALCAVIESDCSEVVV